MSERIVTAGTAFVETLYSRGVQHVFGIVGADLVEILDALYGCRDLRYIGVRHEQAAAHMADGYARSTGLTGVCMACGGPGATNLVTGIASAYVNHSPVVAILGSPPTTLSHRDSFQEIDQVSLFRPITKAQFVVPQAQRIPELVQQAFRVAQDGKKGPVVLVLPRDVGNQDVSVGLQQRSDAAPLGSQPRAGRQELEEAAELLLRSKRPVILAGAGVKWSGAHGEVAQLAESLGAAIVSAYASNDCVDNLHPHFLGSLGRAGSPEAIGAMKQADVLLVIGSGLGHFTTFYDHRYISLDSKLVHIDIDGLEIGRHFRADVGIVGDARETVRDLIGNLDQRDTSPEPRRPWLEAVRALVEKRRGRVEALTTDVSTPMKSRRVYGALREVLPEDAVLVADAGAAAAGVYDLIDYRKPRTLVPPGRLACVGSGLPSAIGAKFANPERAVVAISGDGAFLMNSQELETAVRERVSVLIVVMTNNCWGSEKAYQKYLYGERYVGTDFGNPPFHQLAELYGAAGFRVDDPESLSPTLSKALRVDGPAVVEIAVDPDDLPFPARAEQVRRRYDKESEGS